ncbi:hypothetical protein ACVDG8_000615 [Mesorhizobium sp. ORM8.1]
MAFAIKAEVQDTRAMTFTFTAQKTMYGGKRIAEGDTVFVFASENEGRQGLVARGVVTSSEPVAKRPDIERQTPRISVAIRRTALATTRLGRDELKRFKDWQDGRSDRTQLQILSPGNEQNRRHLRRHGGVSRRVLLDGWDQPASIQIEMAHRKRNSLSAQARAHRPDVSRAAGRWFQSH